MGASAPGVVGNAARIFITQQDVAAIFGCGKSMAYRIVREVNASARKKGYHTFPAGKASKYLFADIYGIPIEEVDRVIQGRQVVESAIL